MIYPLSLRQKKYQFNLLNNAGLTNLNADRYKLRLCSFYGNMSKSSTLKASFNSQIKFVCNTSKLYLSKLNSNYLQTYLVKGICFKLHFVMGYNYSPDYRFL